MRGILLASSIASLCVACGGRSADPVVAAPLAGSTGAYLAHDAYVAAINSYNLGLVIHHRDADRKWRVARDPWGPDHPVR